MNCYSQRPDITLIIECRSVSLRSCSPQASSTRGQVFIDFSTKSEVSKFSHSFTYEYIVWFNISVNHVHFFQFLQGQKHLIEYFEKNILPLSKEVGWRIWLNQTVERLFTVLKNKTHYILCFEVLDKLNNKRELCFSHLGVGLNLSLNSLHQYLHMLWVKSSSINFFDCNEFVGVRSTHTFTDMSKAALSHMLSSNVLGIQSPRIHTLNLHHQQL